ncbi:hypothetical protein H257_02232 [Aphanomyces astaci]|nr:hypothetical protein H257_02232 [Aphanomyces astaci]ETV87286.1 hypothetical protein H257_02232 [Aphanomyces astaci]|eukprot:XP_009824085.1 hypothetical protein H257_02232 [Aphanomyces astaci]
MYSGHLAIPSCTNSTGFDKRDDLLDFPTFSNESVNRHPHVHARQDLIFFSKSHFRRGDYDHMQLHDLNLGKVSEYATFMALQATTQYKLAIDKR